MKHDSESAGQITVGSRDQRITRIGYFLRKYKIDETPQFINVLLGEMSLVGPRPEVPRYVELYTELQKKVLTVKPGITDYASVEFVNENELLKNANNPEIEYREIVMPQKLDLNMKYIQDAGMLADLHILIKTFLRIIRN